MPNTFELIVSSTVGSGGASSIDFTSIPSTYTDLCFVVSARSDQAATLSTLTCTFNGSTSGYTDKWLEGSGSAATSGSNLYSDKVFIGEISGATGTTNTFGNAQVYIPNYSSTSVYKSVSSDAVQENNTTTAYVALTANLWSNTAAITSISIKSASGNLVQYSTAYLYGVKNA